MSIFSLFSDPDRFAVTAVLGCNSTTHARIGGGYETPLSFSLSFVLVFGEMVGHEAEEKCEFSL